MIFGNKEILKNTLFEELNKIGINNNFIVDKDLLIKGVEQTIKKLEDNIGHPDELDNYRLFPIVEDISNSIQGLKTRNALIDIDTRDAVVNSIENHFLDNGIKVASIGERIARLHGVQND